MARGLGRDTRCPQAPRPAPSVGRSPRSGVSCHALWRAQFSSSYGVGTACGRPPGAGRRLDASLALCHHAPHRLTPPRAGDLSSPARGLGRGAAGGSAASRGERGGPCHRWPDLAGEPAAGGSGGASPLGAGSRGGCTLAPQAVDAKTHEMPGALALWRPLVLEGRMVTRDAFLTQRQMAQPRVAARGDYGMLVKEPPRYGTLCQPCLPCPREQASSAQRQPPATSGMAAARSAGCRPATCCGGTVTGRGGRQSVDWSAQASAKKRGKGVQQEWPASPAWGQSGPTQPGG
jgi:hypothetical protein